LRGLPGRYEILRELDQGGMATAGDRSVLVHGAYTPQRALEAGVLDELQIHLIPVLFGSGLRQFDVLPSRVELEVIRVIDTPDATHIRYRVRR
jgi:dihydrofolate reductase